VTATTAGVGVQFRPSLPTCPWCRPRLDGRAPQKCRSRSGP